MSLLKIKTSEPSYDKLPVNISRFVVGSPATEHRSARETGEREVIIEGERGWVVV